MPTAALVGDVIVTVGATLAAGGVTGGATGELLHSHAPVIRVRARTAPTARPGRNSARTNRMGRVCVYMGRAPWEFVSGKYMPRRVAGTAPPTHRTNG